MIAFFALVYDERVDRAAPAPRRMVAAGKLGPGIAAIVATAEVVDDSVLERQDEILERAQELIHTSHPSDEIISISRGDLRKIVCATFSRAQSTILCSTLMHFAESAYLCESAEDAAAKEVSS